MPERLEQIALSHRMLEAMRDGGIAPFSNAEAQSWAKRL